MFNPDLLVCDWPTNVDCAANSTKTVPTPSTTATTTTTKTTTITTSECESGIHAHETECDKYYMCDYGHRWPDQQCPDGLLFNSEKLTCDFPNNVTCPGTTVKLKLNKMINLSIYFFLFCRNFSKMFLTKTHTPPMDLSLQ